MNKPKGIKNADDLAVAAGVDLRTVARHWPIYKPRLTEKQLKNRIAAVRKAVRHGRLHSHSMTRLSSLFKCSPMFFLYGVDYYNESMVQTGATGTDPAAARAGHSRRRNRPNS